jgi:hypothetical protein
MGNLTKGKDGTAVPEESIRSAKAYFIFTHGDKCPENIGEAELESVVSECVHLAIKMSRFSATKIVIANKYDQGYKEAQYFLDVLRYNSEWTILVSHRHLLDKTYDWCATGVDPTDDDEIIQIVKNSDAEKEAQNMLKALNEDLIKKIKT